MLSGKGEEEEGAASGGGEVRKRRERQVTIEALPGVVRVDDFVRLRDRLQSGLVGVRKEGGEGGFVWRDRKVRKRGLWCAGAC
jgi:hypothetical protein